MPAGKKFISMWISIEDYKLWRKSGYKAAPIFHFGLKYNDLLMDYKLLENQLKNLEKSGGVENG